MPVKARRYVVSIADNRDFAAVVSLFHVCSGALHEQADSRRPEDHTGDETSRG
jgi:hypothetical protein